MLTTLLDSNRRTLRRLNKLVAKINRLAPRYAMLTDDGLAEAFRRLKQSHIGGRALVELMPEAYALVREVAFRRLGLRAYDTQVLCALALHAGAIAEMKTGEGKTMAAVFAACLETLSGNQVHVVTANEYLALRDARQMSPVYNALGIDVAAVLPSLDENQRKLAYSCAVVYGPALEFANDYLHDRLVYDSARQYPHRFGMAIVDEADFVLLDSARAPVSITGPVTADAPLWSALSEAMTGLEADLHYEVDLKTKEVHLKDAGIDLLEDRLSAGGILIHNSSLYAQDNDHVLYKVLATLRAHYALQRDLDYLVADQNIVLINPQTGRAMPGRRWTDGLHQALEAKEGLAVTDESVLLAGVSYQNYFRLYPKVAGMTGTAKTESDEFARVYGLPVIEIPTNQPVRRVDHEDLVFRTHEEKVVAVVEDVARHVAKGRPVMVGTISVGEAELITRRLMECGHEVHLLTAKQPELEARLLALAGQPGRITVATNMAGRGVDILLGGNLAVETADMDQPTPAELDALKEDIERRRKLVIEAGGMHVIGTERHDSRRADNQLRGRVGRQGDPGSSQYYLSLDDKLIRAFAPDRVEALMDQLRLGAGEALAHPWVTRTVAKAQKLVEEFNYKLRRELLSFDNVLDAQRRVVYSERDKLLATTDIAELFEEFLRETAETLADRFVPERSIEEQWDLAGLRLAAQETLGVDADWQRFASDDLSVTPQVISQRLADLAVTEHQSRRTGFGEASERIERHSLLLALDIAWREHLTALERLRSGIHLRAYAGKDPVQEYQLEAGRLFSDMAQEFRFTAIRFALAARPQTAKAAA